MRNISCSHTKEQVRARIKTVTRRDGWRNLKPGTLLRIVEKGMGLKPGEKIVTLAIVRVEGVRREPLNWISKSDCRREGFPDYAPKDFIKFFCQTFKKKPTDHVTRIAWRYENRCFGCGCEVSPDSTFCGECLCEEDGL